MNERAGQKAQESDLVNIDKLIEAYFEISPDVTTAEQKVAFGTSGHRGTPLDGSFTEAHILAIAQAICLYRREKGIDGPLFLGIDTHALSRPAFETALEDRSPVGTLLRPPAHRRPKPRSP